MTLSPGKKNRMRLWMLIGIGGLAVIVALIMFIELAQPLEPEAPSQALLAAAEGLDDIVISAVFDPDNYRMEVRQQLTLENRGSEERSTLVLRAYANAFQSEDVSPVATEELYDRCYPAGFSSGSLSVTECQLDGKALAPAARRYTDTQKTVMEITLDSPWQPGETRQIDIRYTLNIPRSAGRFGVNGEIWALGNAFLQPAVFEEGAYRTEPYYAIGDPFLSDCANFAVTVDVPDAYMCAGSAWPSVAQAGDRRLYQFTAYAVRDFALCLSKSYRMAQAMEGDVLLTVYAENQRRAKETLGYASKAVRCYEARYGKYPYPAMTFAEVDSPFAGMEYPSLLMLASSGLAAGGETLEMMVAHEAAHQWWYGVVGNDPINQAWQDEALCEYSYLDYVETYYGLGRRADTQFRRIETAMRITVPKGVTPGSPITYFGDLPEYTLVVYQRGAALLCTLNDAMEGRLDDFLKSYYHEYSFKRPTRDDFERSLTTFSGEDWSPLMVDYLDTYLQP